MGLDTKPEHYQEDIPEETRAKMPTFRKMFIGVAGGGAAKNQEDAMDLQQLVLKLRVLNTDGDYVDVEDAQHRLLIKKTEENPSNNAAFFQAQMFQILKDAKAPPKAEPAS